MSDPWVQVFSTTELYKLHMAKAILERHQITSMILDQQDSMYQSLNAVSSGYLIVRSNDVLRAKHILQSTAL